MTDSSYAKSIELPTDQIFRNLKNAKRFAIDIGLYHISVSPTKLHSDNPLALGLLSY